MSCEEDNCLRDKVIITHTRVIALLLLSRLLPDSSERADLRSHEERCGGESAAAAELRGAKNNDRCLSSRSVVVALLPRRRCTSRSPSPTLAASPSCSLPTMSHSPAWLVSSILFVALCATIAFASDCIPVPCNGTCVRGRALRVLRLCLAISGSFLRPSRCLRTHTRTHTAGQCGLIVNTCGQLQDCGGCASGNRPQVCSTNHTCVVSACQPLVCSGTHAWLRQSGDVCVRS